MLKSQIVTTKPSIIQPSTTDIILTYHADLGNKGLQGQKPENPIYAHVGLITSNSTSPSDWKYATSWGDNSEKYRMTYVDNDTWQLRIPDLYSYFGFPKNSSEDLKKIALVFRNSDCSAEGKDAVGGDIFVDILPDGYSMHLKGNLSGNSFTSENNTLTFSLVANRPSNLKLFINNELFSEVDHKSELHLTHTFTEKGKQYVIKGVASCDNETLCDSLTYFFVDESVQKNYPGGVPKQGVVKNADGSCTFCIAAPNKYSVLLVGSWDDYQITDMISASVSRVEIPLKMHIGAPCTALVTVGDRVNAGQLIAQPPEGALGAVIHASISGRVTAVGERIVIEKE